MNLSKIFSWTFFGIAIFGSLFFSSIVSFITNIWWFDEVGYRELFLKSLTTQVIVGVVAGSISALFLITNFLIAAHSKIPWLTALPKELVGQYVTVTDRVTKRIGIFILLGISFLVGIVAAGSWQDVLSFMQATPFGQKDPIFGKDISFYVFSLPMYLLGIGITKTLILFSLIGSGVIYFMRGKFHLSHFIGKNAGKNLKDAVDTKARIHLGILFGLFLVTVALSTYLSQFSLLTKTGDPFFGAAFTDVNIMIPLLKVSLFLYGLAAIMALVYAFTGNLFPMIGALGLTLLLGIVTAIVPPVFQKLIVAPNELVKETPYIKHNIAATRDAYGLTDVEERTITANKPLTAADITANNLTIKNVRLWDRDPLLSTFSQIQEIRTYYEFSSVDNDRYIIDGELRQIMLSPRELATESLPNKNWINEHLTFTHGYGIAAGPVNQVTPEGLPVLFVQNLPPQSSKKELAVTRPEMYYGELVNDYVITKSKAKEFDYPKGDENVYTTYTGNGGVSIDSWLKRLIYAVQFNSLKFFLSEDITNESRILYHREISERVQKIAPFLTYDQDPYLVVADGKLFWMIDAYTSANQYPYAQQVTVNGQTINYLRNSVKIVVDAYSGDVTFYQSDSTDPIIKTYAKIFPGTFKPLTEMPESLREHIRYPEDIFTVQTAIYTTYHMDDPQIFYNKEDQWEIPAIAQEGEQAAGEIPPMTPRHMIMKLPGEKTEEYILMLPFTPRAKDNLAAWMVARNDKDAYGKVVVYRFPKDKLVYGPKQVIGRINQDAEISRQVSLWDQRGSQVIQGPLLVIPIEESLVYVRPLYLKAESGKIPELKRVIVAYGNDIEMEATLEEGLAKIFGTSTEKPAEKETTTTEDPAKTESKSTDQTSLLQQASETYETALQSQRNGDWATYGEEIKKLGEILQQLR